MSIACASGFYEVLKYPLERSVGTHLCLPWYMAELRRMSPQQRVFLVTGGSSVLGAACVRRLLACGAQVAILDMAEPPPEIQDRAFYQE